MFLNFLFGDAPFSDASSFNAIAGRHFDTYKRKNVKKAKRKKNAHIMKSMCQEKTFSITE